MKKTTLALWIASLAIGILPAQDERRGEDSTRKEGDSGRATQGGDSRLQRRGGSDRGDPRGGSDPRRGRGGASRSVELVDKFDTDEDGVLDAKERDEARAWMADQPPVRRGPGRSSGPAKDPSETLHDFAADDAEHYPDAGLYDVDVLRTFFLEFEQDDWYAEMDAFYRSDVELPARLTVDGITYPRVGVNFRGNSSYGRPRKKSLGMSIDTFDKDQELYGYRTLNLLNSNGDPTMMREVLFSQIARETSAAPKANFVRVVINGKYFGVFANIQQINKDFLKDNFDTKKGIRWKIPPAFGGQGALTWQGPDLEAYKAAYELKTGSGDEDDWADLIKLCQTLEETPDGDLKQALPAVLDVERALWFLALDNVFQDSDGYFSRGSDYMLYKGRDGRFVPITYDNNETMKAGGPGGGPRPGGDDRRRGGFQPPDRDQRREGDQRREAAMLMGLFFSRFVDDDGDGKVTAKEWKVFVGDSDPDRSGTVTQNELADNGLPERLASMLTRILDSNGDQKLGTKEFQSAFATLDKNQDRTLAAGELQTPSGRADQQRSGFRPPDRGNPPEASRSSRGRRGGGGSRGGGGGHGGASDPLTGIDDPMRPLIRRLLSVPEWRATYLKHVKDLATHWLDWKHLGPLVEGYRALIEPSVKNDVLGPGLEAFRAGIDSEHSIKSFAAERRKHLLEHDQIK